MAYVSYSKYSYAIGAWLVIVATVSPVWCIPIEEVGKNGNPKLDGLTLSPRKSLTFTEYTEKDYAWAKAYKAKMKVYKGMTPFQIVRALKAGTNSQAEFEDAVCATAKAFFTTHYHMGQHYLTVGKTSFRQLSMACRGCCPNAFWCCRVFQAAGYEARMVSGSKNGVDAHFWCEIHSGVAEVGCDRMRPIQTTAPTAPSGPIARVADLVRYRKVYDTRHKIVLVFSPDTLKMDNYYRKYASVETKDLWGPLGQPKAPEWVQAYKTPESVKTPAATQSPLVMPQTKTTAREVERTAAQSNKP
jgi:hypothetical protein